MLNIEKLDYDCTKKCRLQQHGDQITSAITKRAIDDNKLAAYIAKTCRNFSEIVDKSGRSALHMSCSVDRYTIVEWLINQGSAINFKDTESGSSPLHRAIFYGCIDCAILLLRYGANCELLDNNTRSPLQHCCKMSKLPNLNETSISNDLLVWGTNKNHNIGISSEKNYNLPQLVDFFRKANICIRDVSLSTYHSLFLDIQGNLFAVGHGKGGRLGIGTENSLPVPKKVKVPLKDEKICCISCSKNHSLILTNKSSVFACGLNNNQQLGLKTCPDLVTSFKEVTAFKSFGVDDLIRVIATEHHSIAYNKNQIYAWGANFGQFGINSSTPHVLLPRLINDHIKSDILFVEANNLGMVCVTSSNQIIVFYNYKVRVIKAPHSQKIKSVSLSGGDSVKFDKGTPSAFKILMLTESNVIFIWYENIQQYLRCSYTHIHLNVIDKIFYKSNQVLILSDGDVYTGKCIQVPVHNIVNDSSTSWHSISQSVNDKCMNQKIRLELNRIPNIDRAVDIFCDDAFTSFAILQESSQKYYNIPKLLSNEKTVSHCFNELLNSYEEDGIHDIVFHVGNDIFYAHKFIIYSRSPGLKSIIEQNDDTNVFLNVNGISAKIFEYILKHIYYNYFVTYEDLSIIQESLGFENSGDQTTVNISSTLKFFLIYVNKFKLAHLENYLNCLLNELPFDPANYQFNCLKRTSLPKFYDVIIKCEDDKIIQAHKCVLITRLEYFNLMFAHNWLEKQAVIHLQSVPYEYMLPIVDFLYTSDDEHVRKQNYSENFLYNMIVYCDQFFATELQRVCEILILEHISIRKCGEMLEFACLYNCNTLKLGCLEFIVQNLARVLMAKSLENCEPEVLKSINQFYRNKFKNAFDYRIITPDSEAVEDSVLLSYVDDFEVDLYHKIENEGHTSKKIKTKENNFKLRTRQYEKDAILSMKELSLDDKKELFKIRKSDIELEAKEISDNIQSEAVTWMKVSVHKKDTKRKPLLPIITPNIANDIALNHDVDRTPTKNNVDKTIINKIVEPTSATRTNFNLSDFTPLKTEKMSQKQRKRLSSGSQSVEPTTTPTKPIDIPQKPNAWRVCNVISPKSENASTSVENSIVSPSSGPSPKPTSMWKIIAEEKEQREYFNRIRSKSLALTQIEEKAITELRKFYNVENVDDENITIERYNLPANINFPTWQKS